MTADNLRKHWLQCLDRIFIRNADLFYSYVHRDIEPYWPNNLFIWLHSIRRRRHGSWGWTGAYVLMPEHLHAFVGFDDQQVQLSEWMKSLKYAFENAAPKWCCSTALAKRFLRPRLAKRRALRGEVALYAREAGAVQLGKELEGLAVLWGDL